LQARWVLHGGAGHHILVLGEDGGGGDGAHPLVLALVVCVFFVVLVHMFVGVFFVMLFPMCLFLGCRLVSVVCLVVALLEE
jgi:hypothetical protein